MVRIILNVRLKYLPIPSNWLPGIIVVYRSYIYGNLNHRSLRYFGSLHVRQLGNRLKGRVNPDQTIAAVDPNFNRRGCVKVAA